MTEEALDPRPGDVIAGRYRIEGFLGRGGMGTVWRATQLALGRTVALKLMVAGQASSAESRARFEREARVASAVEHPGVVAIHDFGEHEGALFLVMELLEGKTLRDVLEDDRASLTIDRVVDVAAQIAEVLVATHAIGLVHRDLKPENVFVREDRSVVVVDFGLAFIDAREGAARMTAEGIVTGTPDFMSPEQARGDRVGPPTDVYALGCILFEMITGRPLFGGQPMLVLTQHMFAPPPRPSEIAGALPITRLLEDLVIAMLAKPEASRPTAGRARETLLEATPSGSEARERARDRTFLLGRDARVLPRAEADREIAQPDPLAAMGDAIGVAIVGEPEGDLIIALTASGLVPYVATRASMLAEASVIYAPGADVAAIDVLARYAAPVISDTDPADIERIAALARAGAAEVIPRPVGPDELARKIFRAHKRARRSRRDR